MLEFFRKYQKFFFVFVTALIIASFSFFGTFNTFTDEGKLEDQQIGHAIDGSPIYSSEVQKLSRFLSQDREDGMMGRGANPNFLNDGVIRYDFLRTGLADVLAAAYFDPLKEGLQLRLEKAKRYKPYAHPEAPFLSARAVWERVLPGMARELDALVAEKEVSPNTFTHLTKLYLSQGQLQPELLRRILAYQHQQYPWLPIDQRLGYEDLALFGFHTVADWFGNDFVDLIAQFILNGAKAAAEKGYRVSLEEAKGDLIHNFEQSMQKLAQGNAKPEISFHQHIRMLGFDERSATESWQKVLLFRRYFQEAGQATFVDHLPYRDFAGFAQETAVVQAYEWPLELRLKNFQDLVEFQLYLKAVTPGAKEMATLPATFYSVEEVEKKYPDLVQSMIKANVRQISKVQIGLSAPMKQVWEWQVDEKNWERLRKELSFLPRAEKREDRFQILEKLEPAFRVQVDSFTRAFLVDENPSWIEEALAKSAPVEKHFALSSIDVYLPGIENGKELAPRLEAAIQNKEPILFSDLGKTFYRFEQVEKVEDRHVLTFEKARPVLAKLAEREMEEKYKKVRATAPEKFQTKNGDWKPLKEVKEDLARIAYADLFKGIEKSAGLKSDSKIDTYATHRLFAAAQRAQLALQKNPNDTNWLRGEGDPLKEQFKLHRKEQRVQRTSQEEWMKEQAFMMGPDQWSPVHVADYGQVVFFYLQEKRPAEVPILDRLTLGKETLAADAQRYLGERLIQAAKEKQAIVIPIQREKE